MLHIRIGVQSRAITLLLGCMAAMLVICIIIYPSPVFQSSLSGMTLWWKYVFPSLLPFLILSEIAIGAGVIRALGTLLDPLTRWMFGFNGNGGWAFAMGLFAGFPAGASTASTLLKQKAFSPPEAERVLAISHLCNPVVMVTVIGIGFFHQAAVGIFIAIIHYISAFLLGFILRWRSHAAINPHMILITDTQNIFIRALKSAKQAQTEDGRTFGKMLGDSVTGSIQTIMVIGGWMMFFSVLIQVISLLLPIAFSQSHYSNVISSLLEPHLGAYAISQNTTLPLLSKIAFVGAILGWSGLSIHAQVKSFMSSAIRYMPFLLARMLHAALAFICSVLLWAPYNAFFGQVKLSMAFVTAQPLFLTSSLWPMLGSRLFSLLSLLLYFLLGALFISLAIRSIQLWSRKRN
jgi:sporulation integral membrane protein YlbJ